MRRRHVKESDEGGAVAAGAPSDPAASRATDDVDDNGGAPRKGPNDAPPQAAIAFRRLDESPRQVLTGALLCASLTAVARNNRHVDEAADAGASFRAAARGTWLLCASYTFLNARDGTMRRPHPGVWRALHGCNLWYCAVCAAFLVVRAEDGAAMMGWLFPDVTRADDGGRGPLGGVGTNVLVEVESDGGSSESSGSSSSLGMDHLDCRLTLSNIRRQVFGLWFFAHCVGWWAKMLMLRDLRTCLVYSTIFELVELTLQALVPEFQECWWDSIGLDWLIANTCVGMTLGTLTHRYLLRWPDLDWNQRNRRRNSPGRAGSADASNDNGWKLASRLVNALTPATWRRFDWNPDNDPVSLVLNSVIWIAMLIGEVNSFFLINILQLPRDHAFNVLRQAFFCLTALPACEEWYEYTRHVRFYTTGLRTEEYDAKYAGNKPRIGQSAWLLAVTVFVETAAIVKYSVAFDLFSRAGAFTVGYWGPWVASGALFGTYLAVHYLWYRKRRPPRWLGMLKWLSSLPLLLLMRKYAF